jgi:hypothetical protein
MPNELVREAKTAQSPDGTRAWFVVRDHFGDEYVVYCDVQLLNTTQQLCTAWAFRDGKGRKPQERMVVPVTGILPMKTDPAAP